MTGLPSLRSVGCAGSGSWPQTYRIGMRESIPFRESLCDAGHPNNTGMDAKTNRTAWMRALVAEAGGPAAWVAAYGSGTKWSPAQVSQWTSEDRPKGIGHALARSLEQAQGLPSGAIDGPFMPQSQAATLDTARLGIALAAIDNALRHVEIQGALGTLAEAVQYAYRQSFHIRDITDRAQLELFDELVSERLGGRSGRSGGSGVTRQGEEKDRPAAPPGAVAWGRKRPR